MSYGIGSSYRKIGSSSSPTRPTSFYSPSSSLSLFGGGYSQNLSSSTPYLNSSSYYGGTSSGYGGVYVPSSSISLTHNLSVPSLPGLSPLSSFSRSPTPSQFTSRSSSFNRHRSRQRARSLGASIKSLQSEGYQSGDDSEASTRLKSLGSSVNDVSSPNERISSENGEIIDYKKLYEQSLVENERLRGKLREAEEELSEVKAASEKNALIASRNAITESEKREKRAMERKLSEMEEELKQLQKLKSDNERLRAENRALTRVVSKLTSSHIK